MDEDKKKENNPAPQQNDSQQRDEQNDKIFTQQQVNDIVVNRLAKERQKIFKQLGIEDESKVAEYGERIKNYDQLKQQNEQFKAEKQKTEQLSIIRDQKVDDEFVDYVHSQVEADENYEQNIKDYIKDHPQFLKDNYRKRDSNLSLDGQHEPDIENMTTEQYIEYRNKQQN